MKPNLPSAEEFARWAHAAQRYGEKPYSAHLEEVVEIIRSRSSGDPQLETIGWLHDVLEDTPVTPTFLEEIFGEEVSKNVALITDPNVVDRAERKKVLNLRLRLASVATFARALIAKTADRLANVRASLREDNKEMVKLYKDEYPAFREAAYRPGLCDEWWEELDRALA